MKIDLCFQGWLRGVEISAFTEVATNKEIPASQLTIKEAERRLQNGELAISLKQCLNETNNEEEIEIFNINCR